MTADEIVRGGMRTNIFVHDSTAPVGTFTPRLAQHIRAIVEIVLAGPDEAVKFLFPAGTTFTGDGESNVIEDNFLGLPVEPMPEGVEALYAERGGLFLGYKRHLVAVVTRNNKIVLGGY